MPGIGIIANPHSKLNKRSPVELERLEAILGQKGIFTKTRDLQHLDETICRYRDLELPVFALNGGDGTISQTLTRIIRIFGPKPLPHIALLRGGTMNVIAAHLNIKGTPTQVLTRLLSRLEESSRPPTTKLCTMKIGDVYGFLYADQSSTAILEEFYRNKNGHLEAGLLFMRLAKSFLLRGSLIRKVIQEYRLEAHFEPAGRIDQDVLGCFAGTISKLPMGLSLLPFADKKPGYFQTTVVTCKAERLLWNLPLLMIQQKEGSSIGKHSFSCKQALFRYEKAVHYTIDGEIYQNPTGELLIEVGPEISFLRI